MKAGFYFFLLPVCNFATDTAEMISSAALLSAYKRSAALLYAYKRSAALLSA